MAKNGPITDLHQEYAAIGPYCLTKSGTLVGAIELDGRDPDGLTAADFTALSLIARSVYQDMSDNIASISQYYVHYQGDKIALRSRKNRVSNVLSKNRQGFLNKRNLSASRIVHFIEISPDENLIRLNPVSILKHLVLSTTKKSSRKVLRRYFSTEKAIVVYQEHLKAQQQQLDDVLDEIKGRWESIFESRILNANRIWSYLRFFSNLNPGLLTESLTESVPDEQWDLLLAEGDRFPVVIDNKDYFKFCGVENVYAQILSVTRFGEHEVERGAWAAKAHSPLGQKGNYVLMSRFSPYSSMRQSLMFSNKKRELHRKNLNLYDLFKGIGENAGASRHENLKPAIRKKMEELEQAEILEERWGQVQSCAVIFDSLPENVTTTAKRLRKSMLQSQMSVVLETINLPDAYKAFLPGGSKVSIRNMEMNATQFGAVSHLYKSAEGQITVDDLQGEEAQYIFQSANGTPFHYSPFTGGRGVTICVGPVRSGKSFVKNTVGSHFVKYGGFYRALDIDPGSETLAQVFDTDGAVFRIGEGTKGFNPFHVARGPEDFMFVSHLKNTVVEMLKTNENIQMQTLEAYEQQKLDEAIIATLKLPQRLQRFSTMVKHCPSELQQKLTRWTDKGMYAGLFDQEIDAIGSLDIPVAAFNLAGVKDDPVTFPLTMNEIFYRVTRMFEDPAYRATPKFLDIDEAHALLKVPHVCEYIIRSVRTWGKWMAGIGLWSQDPNEYLKIPEWTALRSAASTFFFMADPSLAPALYRDAFGLTDGEIKAIKELRPKKQAYIIQKDIGVSKKIQINVEPEQYVISTSRPHEAQIRQRNVKALGVEKGILETIKQLNLKAA